MSVRVARTGRGVEEAGNSSKNIRYSQGPAMLETHRPSPLFDPRTHILIPGYCLIVGSVHVELLWIVELLSAELSKVYFIAKSFKAVLCLSLVAYFFLQELKHTIKPFPMS